MTQADGAAAKMVLCFGDSNTWGYDPATRERFGPAVRWTGVLQRELGDGYRVIEEGLNGRTTLRDDPIEPYRNGLAYLRPCLLSHQPLDLITIMLGTNDLKQRFAASASEIAQSATRLAETALELSRDAAGRPTTVLLMIPPPLAPVPVFDQMFEGGEAKSRQFADYYRRMAEAHGIANVLDAGSVIVSSPLDGIHFEAEEHAKLGRAVGAEVRRLLGG